MREDENAVTNVSFNTDVHRRLGTGPPLEVVNAMVLVFCVLKIFQNCFGLLFSNVGRVALKNMNLVNLREDEYLELRFYILTSV